MKAELLFFLSLLFAGFELSAAAVVDIEIDVSNDLAIEVRYYPSKSSSLLIWLPSERGQSNNNTELVGAIAESGFNIWIVDLHGSYLVPPSRYSLDRFSVRDVARLVEVASEQGYREIFFVSASRGAKLALEVIYQYSRTYPESEIIKGSIFFYPNLFKPDTLLGEHAEFFEVSAHSHLPVYLLQAEYSTKFHFTEIIRERLESGGSQVFTHRLANVEAGFVSRPVGDLAPESIAMRHRLPEILARATALMSSLPRVRPRQSTYSIEKRSSIPRRTSALQPYLANKTASRLRLRSLQDEIIDLEDYKGRVVLLNFWASWCKPCVDEIPSLARLGRKYPSDEFTILTVNIGEEPRQIEAFIRPLNVDFEVLLDEDGKAVRDWRVYAFPSNFLIDRQGLIQFGYRGALQWDSKEVTDTIESLL